MMTEPTCDAELRRRYARAFRSLLRRVRPRHLQRVVDWLISRAAQFHKREPVLLDIALARVCDLACEQVRRRLERRSRAASARRG